MRKREEIEKDVAPGNGEYNNYLIVELLLDIRELLSQEK